MLFGPVSQTLFLADWQVGIQPLDHKILDDLPVLSWQTVYSVLRAYFIVNTQRNLDLIKSAIKLNSKAWQDDDFVKKANTFTKDDIAEVMSWNVSNMT